MKKILLLLTLLLIPFIAKAEDYEEIFSTPKVYSNMQYNFISKDGYIFIDILAEDDNRGTLFTYYDKQGNLIRSKEFEDCIYYIFFDGEDLYGRYEESFLKFDDEFNVVATFDEDDLAPEYSGWDMYSTLHIRNDKVFFIIESDASSGNIKYVLELDKNFENPRYIPESEYDGIDYYTDWHEFTYADGFDNSTYITIGDYQYAFGTERINCVNYQCERVPYLAKVDKNHNIVWKKNYSEFKNITEVNANSKYLFVIVNNSTEINQPKDQDLIMMDLDGNIVKTLIKNAAVDMMSVNEDTIAITTGKAWFCMVANYNSPGLCKSTSIHTVYKLTFNIESKVEGKGKVEVISTSPSGEGVTFKVTPEEGYVLSEVKVTDANGNVITFHDYTFTMPSSDVLVEAVFVPAKNPNTKTFITYIVIILGGISLITLYLLRQRKSYLIK